MLRATDLAVSALRSMVLALTLFGAAVRARSLMDRVDGKLHWHAEGNQDSIGGSQPVLSRGVTVEQDSELVPTQAATGVGGADRG